MFLNTFFLVLTKNCIILQEELASLLRYESSFTKPGETTSFDEYIKRRQEGQNDIYYLSAPK